MRWMLAVLAIWFGAAPVALAQWKVGVATTNITPTEWMWMAGYAARKKPAEAKASDLFAKALVIEDAQGKRVVFVTMDLISVPRLLRDRLAATFEKNHQLPPDALMMNCSHTHCGPELRVSQASFAGLEPARLQQSQRYIERLEAKLIALVGDALKSLAPANLQFQHARCGFAMNRRLPTDKGFINHPYPDGPVDHDVPVLRVDGLDGKLRAVLFGYACHNTTLGFYEWCGDYAGFAQEYIERQHPGATALFMMGCGGDQNPYPRGTIELARQHGMALATSVEAALQTKPRPVRGPLQVGYDLATLDYATPLPTVDVLRQQIKESTAEIDRQHATKLLTHLEKEGKLPASYACPVQVVRFGEDLFLVGLPGETVVDYSLRLKKALAGSNGAVWVAGYCNDVFTYLPSRRVLREGGYEGLTAMRYSSYPHSNAFADTVEERLIGKVMELHQRMLPKK